MSNDVNTHFESLYPPDSRYNEIEKMLDYIKQGQSCQIVGLPGVGQSTFLKLLVYNRNVRTKHLGDEYGQHHFVLTNFSEIRKKSLIDVTKFIFLSLVDSLRERQMQTEYEKTYSIFKESVTLNDELVMFQGLKNAVDILTLEKNLTIVLLFDRFEEYIPMITDDFFQNLRALRNRAKYKFSAVFSLNRPLEDSIEPILMADFAEFLTGHIVYLPLMDEPGLNFRINHLEKLSGKILEKQLREQILQLTGGFGRLMKNCVQVILADRESEKQSFNKNSKSEVRNSKQILNSNDQNLNHFENLNLSSLLLAQSSIQATLFDVWQALTPSEQDFLMSDTTYAESDIDYPYLTKVGLVRDGKLTIPLLRLFMRQSLAKLEPDAGKEPIVFNPDTNEIKQGNDIISDRLTSSEYRLLCFLIGKAGKVTDRESIINAVWKEAVSTAGVTDQALDQLLFRIRKKIEEDPNNPKHLQTVKGRGVRFIP